MATDIVELQTGVKAAQCKYAESVQEFCSTLDEDSERVKEYAYQLRARECEMQAVRERVTAFLMKYLTVDSIGASKARYSKSARSKKWSHDALTSLGTSLSTAARARMEMQMSKAI